MTAMQTMRPYASSAGPVVGISARARYMQLCVRIGFRRGLYTRATPPRIPQEKLVYEAPATDRAVFERRHQLPG